MCALLITFSLFPELPVVFLSAVSLLEDTPNLFTFLVLALHFVTFFLGSLIA